MAIQAGTTLTNFEMNLVHGGSNCKKWLYGADYALGATVLCLSSFYFALKKAGSPKCVKFILGGVSLLAVAVTTGLFIKSFFCFEALDKSED